MLRAMGESPDAHDLSPMLLDWDGATGSELMGLMAALGIGCKVHLLGHVKDVAPYYEAAQIFVMPSITRAEAFGLVQAEAMAAGVPVVNTDLDSGVPEVSIDAMTGITVPPKDADALARAINFLLQNEDVRRKYGETSLKRARAKNSPQKKWRRTL